MRVIETDFGDILAQAGESRASAVQRYADAWAGADPPRGDECDEWPIRIVLKAAA